MNDALFDASWSELVPFRDAGTKGAWVELFRKSWWGKMAH